MVLAFIANERVSISMVKSPQALVWSALEMGKLILLSNKVLTSSRLQQWFEMCAAHSAGLVKYIVLVGPKWIIWSKVVILCVGKINSDILDTLLSRLSASTNRSAILSWQMLFGWNFLCCSLEGVGCTSVWRKPQHAVQNWIGSHRKPW